MANTNVYFTHGTKNEQYLLEDLIVESLSIYGNTFYYIPRTLVGKDEILGEDRLSKFKNAYPIQMYLEDVNGFEGQGSFMQKFGLMVEQSATLTVARRKWEQLVGRYGQTVISHRPAEGDLLYFPLTKGLFEIKFVDHQDPFYQLGKLYVYKLQVELFQYSSEKIDTDIPDIDVFETIKSFDTNPLVSASGRVVRVEITNPGMGYLVPPLISFNNQSGYGAEASSIIEVNPTSINHGKLLKVSVNKGGFAYRTAPNVTITPPDQSSMPSYRATIGVSIQNGSVVSLNIGNPGKFYSTTPNVIISEPTSGVRATATATISNGVVTQITISNPGSGYTNIPTVVVDPPTGAQATAVAYIETNVDTIDSYGDNNKFKEQAIGVVFDANNPFGDIQTNDYPDVYQG